MKIYQLLILTSLIFCNSPTNNDKNQSLTESKQNTITLKFKIDKMLGIGWGTVYITSSIDKIKGTYDMPDSLRIYVAVGNTLKAEIDLHALKIGAFYTAQFIKSPNKSDKSYMPTGTTGFILANRDVWYMQSIQKSMETKQITIKGIALNAKMGAIIQTKKGEVFYLEGIYEWPDEVLEKTVTATGYISSQYYDPKDLVTDDGLHKTGMSGEKLNLQKPTWKIIEQDE